MSMLKEEIRIVVNVIRREQIAEYNRHINIKVIIETAILTRDEIKKVCTIIERSGADFVKDIYRVWRKRCRA